MTARSTELLLSMPAVLKKRLEDLNWRADVKNRLIPLIAELGGKSWAPTELGDQVHAATKKADVQVTTGDLQLMINMICEGGTLDYIAAAMRHLRNLRIADKQRANRRARRTV